MSAVSGHGGLIRRSADFRRFWLGQSTSTFGDEITVVALPTVAILVLHAPAFVVGLLGSATYLAYPVFGLFAGAWVDRMPRRRVLMAADTARLLAVGAIPVAAVTHRLSIPLLFIVGLASGIATSFFTAAYQAYLPTLVPARDILTGNALMEMSKSSAKVAGPSIAGLLINWLGAPFAMIADAATYLLSVLSLGLIRGPDPRPARRRHNLLPDVGEGLTLVWRHALLRRLAITAALANVGRGLALELFLLFAYRGLQLTPAIVGFILAAGAVATLAGSAACRVLVRRFGIGPTLVGAAAAKGLPWLLAPLALALPPVPLMVAILAVSSFSLPVWNVNSLSLRQYMTDSDVLGRVSATVRTTTSSAVPVAGVLGGALAALGVAIWGDRTGLAIVLAIGGALWSLATLALPLSDFLRVRTPDDAIARYGRISGHAPE